MSIFKLLQGMRVSARILDNGGIERYVVQNHLNLIKRDTPAPASLYGVPVVGNPFMRRGTAVLEGSDGRMTFIDMRTPEEKAQDAVVYDDLR